MKRRSKKASDLKKIEQATPGNYGIILDQEGITAAFTATPHCGIHRYRSLSTMALFVNPHSNLSQHKNENVKLELDQTKRVLTGEMLALGDFSRRYGGQPYFMYGEISKPAQRTFQDEKGLWLIWESQGPHYVDVKICLSVVKKENAYENFESEVQSLSFESLQNQAAASWKNWLDRIQITSSSNEIKTIFYSSLYRTGIMPTNYSDSNGDYRSFKNTIKNSSSFKFMSDLSLWDTFRTTHPLYTLIAPEIQRDSLLSLLDMVALNDNRLPLWPQGSGDGGSMFGYPAHFLIAESWSKDQRDFDAKLALSFMKQQSFDSTDPCVYLGYCPADQMGGSVSKTLEKAWANGVSAEYAESLGDTETSLKYLEQSLNFKHIWQNGFFRPRKANGEFKKVYPLVISYLELFNLNSRAFAEGSPHHWRYSVPHRPKDLIELFGGKEKFVRKLNRFMRGATENLSAINPGPYYWHGNEHDFHAIYLLNEAGRADLTQEWARWALETRYANAPKGLDGNDDGGALSAWYVFSALGFYPQAGTNKYWLG